MTIAGIKISESKFILLSHLMERGRAAVDSVNPRTAKSLASLGLIEMFTPDATTYAMAARGRVKYYRLTTAGAEAIKGVKQKYKR